MIEFKPGHYYSTLWFIPFEGMDIMGCLWHELPDKEWIFRYRFRYYAEENNSPWDGKDKKNWYELRISSGESEESVVAKLHMMFDKLAGIHPGWLGEMFEVPVKGDNNKAIDVMTAQSWAHVKEERL